MTESHKMTKLSRKYLSSDKFGQYVNNLWSGFTLMESKDDIRQLFRDLFTHTEYKMFAKRLEIARRLLEGQGYDEIIRQLNVTERTIANISNILADRGEGLRKVHEKLSAIEQAYRDRESKIIERKSKAFNPELAGSKVLPNAIMAGVKYANKKFIQHRKQKSAVKRLNV